MFPLTAPQAFSLIQLLMQVSAALLVAWLAVGWALRRYKAEKIWDRRLAAYCDVVLALGEMHRVNREWFDGAMLQRDQDDENASRQSDRYQLARQRLIEVIATGRLLLPTQTQDTLARFEKARDARPSFDHYTDALVHDAGLIQGALNDVVLQGRFHLGLD